MKVGVIGLGVVGSTMFQVFGGVGNDVRGYDIDPARSYDALEKVAEQDYIFVCINTPTLPHGEQNLEFLLRGLSSLWACICTKEIRHRPVIIIKSTVLPGTTRALQKLYTGMDFVMCPEFLVASDPIGSFVQSTRIVIGGDFEPVKDRVDLLYRTVFKYKGSIPVPFFSVSYEEAEFLKYYSNCFLATKVSFANEMDLCAKALKIDYNKVKDILVLDPRIGSTHLDVPGADGLCGFGGTCFPKDTEAFSHFCLRNRISSRILNAAIRLNKMVRK